jgi:hypothetical protein
VESVLDYRENLTELKEKPPFKSFKGGRSGGGKNGSLGSAAKTSSSPFGVGVVDASTGELIRLKIDRKNNLVVDQKLEPHEARAERYALKSVARKLLPKNRVSECLILRAPDNVKGGLCDIEVRKFVKTNQAYFSGLVVCGRVWECPVCAAKIAERRRQELKDALQVAREKGFGVHLVTLTFPHGAGDDLYDIRKKMSYAYGRLSSGGASVKSQLKKLNEEAEIKGFVRAVEVTHGNKNGFHPHVHMIVFTNKETTSEMLDFVYTSSWQRACRLARLPIPSDERGCTVQDGSKASNYISKWGIEDEMTKANAKKSRAKGVSPFGLLNCVLQGDDPEYSPERASMLFQIYAKAFKGQRQLYWSNGLRKLLSLNKELNDEEVAQREVDQQSISLSRISFDVWKSVYKKKQESNLLRVAEVNAPYLKQFLKECKKDYDRGDDKRRLSKEKRRE